MDMSDWDERVQDVAERLRDAFQHSGLTSQKELADAIGRHQTQVSRYMKGGGLPEWDVVAPLAEALGVSAYDLFWPLLETDDTPPDAVEVAINGTRMPASKRRMLLTFYRQVRDS